MPFSRQNNSGGQATLGFRSQKLAFLPGEDPPFWPIFWEAGGKWGQIPFFEAKKGISPHFLIQSDNMNAAMELPFFMKKECC